MRRMSLWIALFATGCANQALYDERYALLVDADGDGVPAAEDCDDDNEAVSPGVDEVPADGIDQDCDGGDACFADTDGDGAGSDQPVASDDLDCDDAGESDTSDDCDDADEDAFPGADEVPADGVDQDCDGGDTCFADTDEDGFGGTSTTSSGDLDCDDAGESDVATDCRPADTDAWPGADEVFYDGIDQNCDPSDDDDADGDGFSAIPRGGDDCDDTDPDLHPGLNRTYDVPSDEFPTIQAAIDATCDGDVVRLDALAFAEHFDIGRRAITVRGQDGTSVRGDYFTEGPPVRMGGGTIEGFAVEYHDTIGDGGCIAVEDGADVIVDVDTYYCSASGHGGAIVVRDSAGVTIRGDHRLNASDGHGGAIAVFDSPDVTVEDAFFEVNDAEGDGGALYLDGVEGFVTADLRVTYNEALGEGGGIFLSDVTGLDCGGSRLWENIGGAGGTSVAVVGASEGSIANWTVWSAFGDGLAAVTLAGNVTVTNLRVQGSDVAGIAATPAAGGHVRIENVTAIDNTGHGIVARASAAHAVEVVNAAFAYNEGKGLQSSGAAPPDVSYSVAFGNADGDYGGMAPPTGNAGNLVVEPGMLGFPADFSTTEVGYALLPDSPLVDAGDPARLDPDGTRSDIGWLGGPAAGRFDLYDDDDHDGMYDAWEVDMALDPLVGDAGQDADGDGLRNVDEFKAGSDPWRWDTDSDGVIDPDEVAAGTDPRVWGG